MATGFWGRILRALLKSDDSDQSPSAAPPNVTAADSVSGEHTVVAAAGLTRRAFEAPQLLPAGKQSESAGSGRQTQSNDASGSSSGRTSLAVAARREARRRARENERLRLQAIRRADRLNRDITYLGQGVSGWLNERVSDEQRLRQSGLPVLATPADVARALGISLRSLRGLAFHAEVTRLNNYVRFTIPKRSGGVRVLQAPQRRLAAVQQWILREILDRLPVSAQAQGFVRGRSVVTNAALHSGRAVVVNLDVQDFFPSIPFARVRRVFISTGYSKCVATILALVCTECPRQELTFEGRRLWVANGPRGLPQGACTSPALSNLVCLRLDRRLQGLSAQLGLVYSRYADDLTFSGPAELRQRVGAVLKCVTGILREEGLQVHPGKTRVQPRSTAQLVTGLVVNDRPGVRRDEVRRIRAILHRAAREGLQAQNRDGHPNFRAWLCGRIGWIGQSRPELGQQFLQQLNALQ
jgi:hypothetical protein